MMPPSDPRCIFR